MKFDPDYPFSYDDCEHNKFYTDPENVGLCKECMAMNLAVSDDQELDMDSLEFTYNVMVMVKSISRVMEDEE